MKRIFDLKSLIIGILATAIFFILVAAKTGEIRHEAYYDVIRAKKIHIVAPDGKNSIILKSDGYSGLIALSNGRGEIGIILGSINGNGEIDLKDASGKNRIRLGVIQSSGVIEVLNRYGARVATLQADRDSIGILNLYDKSGKSCRALKAKGND